MNKFIADCYAVLIAVLTFLVLGIGALLVTKLSIEVTPLAIVIGVAGFFVFVLIQGLLSTIVASYQLQKKNNEYLAILVNSKIMKSNSIIEKIEPTV